MSDFGDHGLDGSEPLEPPVVDDAYEEPTTAVEPIDAVPVEVDTPEVEVAPESASTVPVEGSDPVDEVAVPTDSPTAPPVGPGEVPPVTATTPDGAPVDPPPADPIQLDPGAGPPVDAAPPAAPGVGPPVAETPPIESTTTPETAPPAPSATPDGLPSTPAPPAESTDDPLAATPPMAPPTPDGLPAVELPGDSTTPPARVTGIAERGGDIVLDPPPGDPVESPARALAFEDDVVDRSLESVPVATVEGALGAGENPGLLGATSFNEIALVGDPADEAEFWFKQSENGTCVPSSIAQIVSEYTGTDYPNEADFLQTALRLDLIEYGPGQKFGNWSGMRTDQAVQLLAAYGVPAHVETGSIDTLAAYLADGRDIMVTVDSDEMRTGLEGQLGSNHALVVTGIDQQQGLVYLSDPLADEAVTVISLTAFMGTWQDGGYQMVVTDHAAPVEAPTAPTVPTVGTPTSPTSPTGPDGPGTEGPETPAPAPAMPGESTPGFVLLPVTIDADDTVSLVEFEAHGVAPTPTAEAVPAPASAPAGPIDLSIPPGTVDTVNDLFQNGAPVSELTSVDQVEALFAEHGLDAEVATDQTVDDIALLIDDGEKVVVAVDLDELTGRSDDDADGGDGADGLVTITSIDTDRGVVVLEKADGSEMEVPIDMFLEAWEDSDHALVQAPDTGTERSGLAPSPAWALVLVPVVVGVGATSAVKLRGMKRA